jgi:hypothetical protein
MTNKATETMLENLITFYPKKQYWVQLSFMYSEQNEEAKQLAPWIRPTSRTCWKRMVSTATWPPCS